jgi:hypothetical protein
MQKAGNESNFNATLERFLVSKSLEAESSGIMRQRIIHYVATLILMFCIWGHVSELFDHWDDTFQTGSDVEFNTVIVVLLVGAVIAFATIIARTLPPESATFCVRLLFSPCTRRARDTARLIIHSPPPPLRI